VAATLPLRLVRLTTLASLSTLVPRERLSFALLASASRRRLDRRSSGVAWIVLCFGGDMGVLFLLAERPERVPAIVPVSRSRKGHRTLLGGTDGIMKAWTGICIV
jgi:hypothetical protein